MGSFKLQALEVVSETYFNTDPAAGYAQLLVEGEVKPDLKLDILGKEKIDIDDIQQAGIRAGKGGTLSFKCRLRGNGTPAGNAVPTATSELDVLLLAAGCKAVFGSSTAFTDKNGSLVAIGGSGTKVNVTDAEGAYWAAGAGIISKAKGAAPAELNFVSAVNAVPTPDEITCVRDWTNDPFPTDSIYNTRTIFIPRTASDKAVALSSFTFRFYHGGEMRIDMTGCCIAESEFSFIGRELAYVTFTVFINEWTVNYAAPGSPAVFSTDWEDSIKVLASPAYFDDVATAVISAVLKLGHKVEALKDVAAEQGRSGWCVTGSEPVLVVEKYYNGVVEAAYITGTPIEFMMQIGDTPGNMFGIYIPSADVVQSEKGNQDGLIGQKLELRPLDGSIGNGDIYICWG